MAKRIIKLILVETPYAKLIVENHLTTLIPEIQFEIVYIQKIDLRSILKKQLGYDYIEYSENILESIEDPANALIITKHPLDTGKRINLLSSESRFFGSSILTLKDLNSAIYVKESAPLIYYFIMQLLGENLEESVHSSSCIGNSQQSYERIPSLSMCDECNLPKEESRSYYEQMMKRVYRNIEKNRQNHHVILTHGIRTFGSWMHDVKAKLESDGYTVSISGYDRFSLLKLFGYVVGDMGNKARVNLKDEILFVRNNYPNSKLSVIAHSHGTLMLSKLLESGEIIIDNAILTGSIIKRDFPWHTVVNNGNVKNVLNDAACRDIPAALAENWVRGAGGSGIIGFQKEPPEVRSIFSRTSGHSSSINNSRHQEKLWLPFLELDEYSKAVLNSNHYLNSSNSKVGKAIIEKLTPKYLSIAIIIIIAYTIFFSYL